MPWVVSVLVTVSSGERERFIIKRKKNIFFVVDVKAERGIQCGIKYLKDLCFFMCGV